MNQSLRDMLKEDVESVFPIDNGHAEPSWEVLALMNPSAPVVSISRDPRSGPRVSPVLFVAAPSEEILYSVMAGMRNGTSGYAPLTHQVKGEHLPHFLVVPAMYHMYTVGQFEEGISAYLKRPEFNDVAWFTEKCEVLIVHEGKSFKAVEESADGIRVLSRPSAAGSGFPGANATPGPPSGLDYAADWPKELKIIREHGPFTAEELTNLDSQALQDYYYVTSWLLRENGEAEFKNIRDEFRGILLRRLEAGLRLNPTVSDP